MHALELARDAGQQRLQASALGLLALHEWRLGDSEAAIGHSLQAIPMLKRTRDAAERAQLLCTLAMAYNEVGLHADALIHVTKALDAARAAKDPSLMSWALNRTGVTYELMGDPERAERFKLQALDIAQQINGSEEMFSASSDTASELRKTSSSSISVAAMVPSRPMGFILPARPTTRWRSIRHLQYAMRAGAQDARRLTGAIV